MVAKYSVGQKVYIAYEGRIIEAEVCQINECSGGGYAYLCKWEGINTPIGQWEFRYEWWVCETEQEAQDKLL